MSKDVRIEVPQATANAAWINAEKYRSMYEKSLKDPDSFWNDAAARLDWFEKWHKVSDWSFKKPVHVQWYLGGKLNVSSNCIDRHIPTRGDQPAIIWEPDQPDRTHRVITYAELLDEVSRLANALKERGVKKGDRVTIYMPMIPEAAFAMLACTRIGAVHSVIFGGFSADAIANRLEDCESDFIITADEGLRGGKAIPLKKTVDRALERGAKVRHVLVYRHTGADVPMTNDRDIWYHDEVPRQDVNCPPEFMDSEDPLFILYTSGSTNKPKGVLHTTGGYLVFTAMTHQYVFDYKEDEVYWCTADIGWVTGHSYVVYGPLANGATTLMHEGTPNYPTPARIWEIVDKHRVNILYTAPTAIRALKREGDEWVKKTSRKSLRILGSVGEPINPEAWQWYYEVVGDKRCPVVDTWWQTETGGILISPLPGATRLKPGSATQPFFGVQPVLVDNDGKVLDGTAEGNLCMKAAWPGMARTLYRDHARFEQTYFESFPGYYFSGDGCRRDADGDYWITGRVDDVLNVSGHRLGTAEIESALVAHPKVAEAAVVGFSHEIKGQGIYVYVQLKPEAEASEELRKDLIRWVRSEISAIATPDKIQFARGLPKTRSGKIMRRILRKIATNEHENLGDTSTLADPGVVDELIQNRVQ